jgi:hypothetical protein
MPFELGWPEPYIFICLGYSTVHLDNYVYIQGTVCLLPHRSLDIEPYIV